MNMKKIKLFTIFLLLIVTVSCVPSNSSSSSNQHIPNKININGVDVTDSSITTANLDDYLFLDDVVYVDLRPYSWVARDGHVAGFSFYPFYDLIAHLNFKDRLFKMSSNGGVGNVGCFTPNYLESEIVINELFSKEKKIFAISQSGLESCYFLNLLIQLGYNPANLYNVGGFAINAGLESKAYINLDNPRYLVEGNPFLDANVTTTFNFMKELTPVNQE